MIAKNIFIAWNVTQESWVAQYDLYDGDKIVEAGEQYSEKLPKEAADKKELIEILRDVLNSRGTTFNVEDVKVMRRHGVTPTKPKEARKPRGMITTVLITFLEKPFDHFTSRHMTQDNDIALRRCINERWESRKVVFFHPADPQPDDATPNRIYGRVYTVKEGKGKKTKGTLWRKDVSGLVRVEFS
jgi:hypothetical protein